MIKKLCKTFQARVENLEMKRGVRRERALVEFMAGAAAAIIETHGEEAKESREILNWVVWHIMIEGYAAVERELKKA